MSEPPPAIGPTIAEMMPDLKAQVETIALAILRDVSREGRELHGRGPDGAKWGIVVKHPKLGVWQNFGTGEGGDLFAFIAVGACGGNARDAWKWAQRYYRGGDARPVPSSTLAPRAPRQATDGGTARGVFLRARPFDWDLPEGLYLQARGIERGVITSRLGALRCSSRCWNTEARCKMPAMFAAIVHPITGEHLATHRTWLEHYDGAWRKARVPHPKKSLGPVRGGVIPLLNGGSSRSLPRSKPGTKLILGEGIENTLSVGQYLPEYRAAAYVSAGNLLSVDLPEAIETVLLIRDRDGENSAIADAREQAITWWRQEGRAVELWEPPPGIKDANDFLADERAFA